MLEEAHLPRVPRATRSLLRQTRRVGIPGRCAAGDEDRAEGVFPQRSPASERTPPCAVWLALLILLIALGRAGGAKPLAAHGRRAALWVEGYRALLAFRLQHGHCDVPRSYAGNGTGSAGTAVGRACVGYRTGSRALQDSRPCLDTPS